MIIINSSGINHCKLILTTSINKFRGPSLGSHMEFQQLRSHGSHLVGGFNLRKK